MKTVSPLGKYVRCLVDERELLVRAAFRDKFARDMVLGNHQPFHPSEFFKDGRRIWTNRDARLVDENPDYEAYPRAARIGFRLSMQGACDRLYDAAIQSIRVDPAAASIIPLVQETCRLHKIFLLRPRYGVAKQGMVDKHRKLLGNLGDYLKGLREQKISMLDEKDGPCGGCNWRHDGEVVEGTMQVGAWKMVKHLWEQADRVASFDELIVPMYGDVNHIADEVTFGAMRREVNRFFKSHGIPWKASVKKSTVLLKPSE